jgi:hypothetical protein
VLGLALAVTAMGMVSGSANPEVTLPSADKSGTAAPGPMNLRGAMSLGQLVRMRAKNSRRKRR